jgi:NADPH2:quinone reductase
VADLCGLGVDAVPLGLDGCGAPALALPLDRLAIAMARWGAPDGLAPDRARACRALRAAMVAAPAMVGGTGRFDTALIGAAGGALISKTGAEGVFVVVAPARGLALALKAHDGATRASEAALAALLHRLNWLDAATQTAIEAVANPAASNWKPRNGEERGMKAMVCKAWGGPDSLVFEDFPAAPLEPNEVRVAVAAAGLNFPDTLMIAGKYQIKPPFPFVPGSEVAGRVVEVGSACRRLKVGDRVMSTTSMKGGGGFCEEAVVAEAMCFRIPDAMSWSEAAGFPITYGTTYHALVQRAHLKAGEVLLVHGAAGGVGLNAVELGKVMGATVNGTVGSDEKKDIVRQYGADHVINYSTETIKDRVKQLTGDKGADVIYDAVGGDAFDQSLRCIAWEGRLLVIGFASGRIPQAPANLLLLKGCEIVGVFWGSFAQREPETHRANFETMFKWYEQGKLKPHVSMTFPLAEVPQAMHALLARKSTGKIVIDVGAA